MRSRVLGLLALALTSSAIASAALARRDPPYDEELALTELASREYHFEDETDVELPTVHCRSETTEETKTATSIVVGRHHLGVEGREVMKLSVDPVADIERQTSQYRLLPLVSELEYQARIADAGGVHSIRVDLYADHSMPFSTLRAVLRSTNDLFLRLVVRDRDTGQLRRLSLVRGPERFCQGAAHEDFFIRDRALLTIDGSSVVAEVVRRNLAFNDQYAALHVIGDPPIGEIAAVVASLHRDCAGRPTEESPAVVIDPRASTEFQSEEFDAGVRCHHELPRIVPFQHVGR